MRFFTPVLFVLAACNQPAPSGQHSPSASGPIGALETKGEPLATLKGETVNQGMMDVFMANMPESQRKQMLDSPQFPQMVKRIAVQQLLYKQAIEAGLDKDPDVLKQVAFSSRLALAAALIQKKGKEAVTDETVKAWYEERKVQYDKPQIKGRHILVKEESKATELLEKIKGGADFAKLAQEFSVDPGSGKKGGDLGWFDKNKMVDAFSAAAFKAEKGEVVGPVETRFGFHIIEVQDKRDSTPLEEVRPQAEENLFREAIQKLTKELDEAVTLEGKAKEAAAKAPTRPTGRPGRPGPPGGRPPGPPRGKKIAPAGGPHGKAPPGGPHGKAAPHTKGK